MEDFRNPRWNIENFLKIAEATTNETVNTVPKGLDYLEEVDLLLREFITDSGDLSPAFSSLLLANAHASWRAAIRLTLSGQLPPVFMALRGSLESALYANAITQNHDLQDIWLNRHKDQESRSRCKNQFSIKKLLRYLAAAQNTEYSSLIKDMYEACIDFGGHPNNRSVISHLKLEELENSVAVELAYLHGSKSPELRQTILACAEIGLALVNIALICSKETKARTEIMTRAEVMQNSLDSLVEALDPSKNA